MAIETMGAALRQINRLFGGGIVTGLSDAQLLDRFRRRGRCGVLRGAGGAARADGPQCLPGRPARPQRRRGRLPGHLRHPGQEGRHDPGGSGPGRLALPGRAPRGDPGEHRRGPATRPRTGGRTDDCRVRVVRPECPGRPAAGPARGDRPAAREIPAAGRPLRPGGPAPGRGRRPVALERADPPPSARRGPRPAQGPADPPRPGARRRRARGGVRPRGPRRRPARLERRGRPRGTARHQSRRHRRGRLGGGPVAHSGGAQDHARPQVDDRLGRPPGRRDAGVGGLGRPDLPATMGPGKRTRHRPGHAAIGRSRAATTGRLARDGRHLPGPRPRARSGWQAGRRGRDLRPTQHGVRLVRGRSGPRWPEASGDGDRRRRPVPLRPRQGVERLALWRRAGLARGADRGRRAGIGGGLGRRRIAAQGG